MFEKIKGLHSEHCLLNPTINIKDIIKEILIKENEKEGQHPFTKPLQSGTAPSHENIAVRDSTQL